MEVFNENHLWFSNCVLYGEKLKTALLPADGGARDAERFDVGHVGQHADREEGDAHAIEADLN